MVGRVVGVIIMTTMYQDWLTKLEEGVRLPQTELCPNYLYSRVSANILF